MKALDLPVLSAKNWRRLWSKVSLPDERGCMLWLGCRFKNGYGYFSVGTRGVVAHRLIANWAHGAPPAGQPEVAHSCRVRHCVAPDHLRWASAGENAADKLRDGTHSRGERQGRSILTEEQVLEIIRRHGDGETQASLAVEFGVNFNTIQKVASGRNWGWLTGVRSAA